MVPTLLAFYFSLTRWTIFEAKFIGFGNYVTFFKEPALVSGLWHTLVYAVLTSGAWRTARPSPSSGSRPCRV